MKTGIYGGTFNPIHKGHIHILREFIRRLGLQRVLLIPAGTPPHKQAPHLASGPDRAAMCRLAAEDIPQARVIVSEIELNRPGKSYTCDTLKELEALYPRDELYFLMGEDMFLTVDKWYQPKEIFARAVLCASPRSPQGLLRLQEKRRELEALGARCLVEDIEFWDISSTMVREQAEAKGDISGLVPPGVAKYIAEHHIYTGGVASEY